MPVSLLWIAPGEAGARGSGALETDASGRTNSILNYTGRMRTRREGVTDVLRRSDVDKTPPGQGFTTPGMGRGPPFAQRTIWSNASPISSCVKSQ